MEIEQTLRAACAPREPASAFEEAVMTRVSAAAWRASHHPRRRSGRAILYGTILVVAAAAAMLAMHLRSSPEPQASTAMPDLPAAEPAAVVVDASPTARQVESAPVPVDAKIAPQETLPQVTPFAVRVLPLQNEATEPSARAAVDSFHAAVLDALRAVPGLILVESDPAAEAPDVSPTYQITFKGMGPTPPHNIFRIAMELESEGAGGIRSRTMSSLEGALAPACGGDIGCTDPVSLAALQVKLLRTTTFPPDESLRRQLQAELLESARDPRQRLGALSDLASLRVAPSGAGGAGAGKGLRDPAVIRGAINLASVAPDPQARAQAWRIMRGVNDPVLRQALVVALRQEADADVRTEIVATLAQGFGGEADRAVLEQLAREDVQPLVRALAQRAVSGDAAWNAYILSSLKDTGRPATERIEAMFHDMGMSVRPVSGPSGPLKNPLSTLRLLDDDAIGALAQVLPVAASESQGLRVRAATLVSALGSIDHPAITKMLLDSAAGGGSGIDRFTATNQLARRSADPVVRAVLEKIAAGDPDPRMREMAATALNPQAGGSGSR